MSDNEELSIDLEITSSESEQLTTDEYETASDSSSSDFEEPDLVQREIFSVLRSTQREATEPQCIWQIERTYLCPTLLSHRTGPTASSGLDVLNCSFTEQTQLRCHYHHNGSLVIPGINISTWLGSKTAKLAKTIFAFIKYRENYTINIPPHNCRGPIIDCKIHKNYDQARACLETSAFCILYYKCTILASIFEGRHAVNREKENFLEELEIRFEDCAMQSAPRASVLGTAEREDTPNKNILPFIKNAFIEIHNEIIDLGFQCTLPFKKSELDYDPNHIHTIETEYVRTHFPDNEIYNELLEEPYY